MKVTGIIAEYNPFHKGHKYQIGMLKERYAPDYIVAVMSGNFVQRGGPALLDKYARAEMALREGVDLVLELPVRFATASADYFALGGVCLLHTTGLVDSLCFGAESDDIDRLLQLSGILTEEPDWYRNLLSSYLKEGCSFPAARAKALPDYADLLETPNNILAVSYLKVLAQTSSNMEPILIRRAGSAYHDTNLSGPLVSASALRKLLLSKGTPLCKLEDIQETLELPQVSKSSNHILQEYLHTSIFLQEYHLSPLLHYKLLQETTDSLQDYADMSEALAARILRYRNDFLSWDSFCEMLKTRDMTYTRINRVLTHILLNLKQIPEKLIPDSTLCPCLPYLRVLGFRKSAEPLLAQLKEHAAAPVLTSLADAKELLTEGGMSMLSEDIFAADIYRSVQISNTQKIQPTEFNRRLLVI